MSLYREHVRAGWKAALLASPFAVLWLVFKYRHLEPFSFGDLASQVGLAVLAAYTMSIFPDIDIRGKARTHILSIVFILAVIFLIFRYPTTALALLALFFGIALFPRHRGLTHSIFMAVLVPAVFLLLPIIYGDGFRDAGVSAYIVGVFSYASHLRLDKATPKRNKKR